MQLKPEEISKIIRAQIKHYENAIEQSETGTVIMVGDGIARASGLEKCMAGELLQFDNGEYGMAQNLEENTVSIVLLGSDAGIKEGSIVKRTGKVVSVPVGDVALEIPLRALAVGGLGQGDHAALARVQVAGEVLYRAALAGGIAAFEQHQHALPGVLHPARHRRQLQLHRFQQPFVFLALELAHIGSRSEARA